MEFDKELQKALEELRKSKERKFDQTVDLIINLQKFDIKKTPVNLLLTLPHKVKEKKIGAFLEMENSALDTITGNEFKKYLDKKLVKNLVKKYDFFIAEAKLMPKVATTFGRILGPAGKMPSPQLGIIPMVSDDAIKELITKINSTLKIRVKESSIKLPVGKQSMEDKDILENISSIYNDILNVLPKQKDNIKNIGIKFTMTKPIKIKVR
jgi:large subunit ribosomal protein L1